MKWEENVSLKVLLHRVICLLLSNILADNVMLISGDTLDQTSLAVYSKVEYLS